ncbi:MAG: O-methyltransferase [Bacteroidetes bacterium]|nr:O-methyltransferase [Bacteroidota bacterium]
MQAFMDRWVSPVPTLLSELEAFTRQHHPEAHMISGAQQGQFLTMISQMIRPRHILEIGTFTGYSALCLSSGLTDEGLLYTIEQRESDADIAQRFFDRSSRGHQIRLLRGDATNWLPTLSESWDLVFIDADKTAYVEYFNKVLPQVRTNGFILADNLFFHGQVLAQPLKGKNAKAIWAFAEAVRDSEEVEQVPIPLRDGLMLIRKK